MRVLLTSKFLVFCLSDKVFNYANGVRYLQPRVELWQPWVLAAKIYGRNPEGVATALPFQQRRRNPFRVASCNNHLLFPRVAKGATRGWNLPTLSALDIYDFVAAPLHREISEQQLLSSALFRVSPIN